MVSNVCGAMLVAAGLSGLLADDGREVEAASEFEPPVRLMAGDQYISVEVGHAAPYMYDFTGNGVLDLLVGQFGQGRMRIYENVGSNKEPQFEDYQYFQAGDDYGTVPSG